MLGQVRRLLARTFNRLVKAVALASSDEGGENDSARDDGAGVAVTARAEIGGEKVRVNNGSDLGEADSIERDGEVFASGETFVLSQETYN